MATLLLKTKKDWKRWAEEKCEEGGNDWLLLDSLTNPKHPLYDRKYTKNILQIHPDWFNLNNRLKK